MRSGGAHSYGGIPDVPALIRPAMKNGTPKTPGRQIRPTPHHNQNSSQVRPEFGSTMGILSCIAVMFLSAISALFAEAFSWYMVYRKPDYQRLKRHIETVAKDLEKKKAEPVGMDSTKKREKGQRLITRLEKDLADAVKELQALATPSKLAVAALVMAVMFGVKKSFEGIVVAKLPFVPFSLLQKISHRGLEGDDATDCAVPFLFALCQATIKANISKLVSVGQPKGVKEPSPFADLNAQYDETEKKIQ